MNELKRTLIEIANPADTWRRDQTRETIAMRCTLNLHPCERRQNSDDNTCSHYPANDSCYSPGFLFKNQAE